MAPNLREHFDTAVGDDPGADTAALAHAAITAGTGLRRRRRLLTGAAVATAAVAALGGTYQVLRPQPEPDRVTLAAAMLPATAPACSKEPVERNATDVAIFLHAQVTDSQMTAIAAALQRDGAVRAFEFENRQSAYERFRALWKDSPDFVASVSPANLPQSFRLRMADPAESKALRSRYAAMAGVQDVVGRKCAADAPIGGVL